MISAVVCGGAAGRADAGETPPSPPPIWCPAVVPPNQSGVGQAAELAGTPVGGMTILDTTRWQPVGGEVQFQIANADSVPQHVRVDFAWADTVLIDAAKTGSSPGQAASAPFCFRSGSVRLVSVDHPGGGTAYTYAAVVPRGLGVGGFGAINGWHHRGGLNTIVPAADVFVTADIAGADGKPAVGIVLMRQMGVTTPWLAFALAGLLLGVGWLTLATWARRLNIQGGPLLRIVSSPYGSASLSQFQILVWTGVIGAGVTYVMLLSGNLIDIPNTTLALLGVTGLALVGSKAMANPDGTPQRASVPGAVTGLAVASRTDTLMVLNWTAPGDAAPVSGYTVQMQKAGDGTWLEIAGGIAGPPYAAMGLTAGTSYNFRVFAVNGAGAGPAGLLLAQSTAATMQAATAAGPGLAQVPRPSAVVNPDGSVGLDWAPLTPAPDGYLVQYRAATALPWTTYDTVSVTPVSVTGLDGGTRYQFRVSATTGGATGAPSPVVGATTVRRVPRWSDLVMADGSEAEIDLGRLQMLLFTSIAAIFTGLALIETGQIPDIPVGELALVGLSNGIYLTHKAVGRTR